MTQVQMILDYLERFGSITPLEAFADLGIMRLSARIWDLRDQGHKIKAETVTGKNRFGDKIAYKKYTLED